MIAIIEIIRKKSVAVSMNCAYVKISNSGTEVVPAHVFEPVADPALHALGGLLSECEGHYGCRVYLFVDEVVDNPPG